MAESIDGVKRFPAKPRHFIDIIYSLEALKAAQPEQSRSPEMKAAIAELERLLGNAAFRLQSIRRGFVRIGSRSGPSPETSGIYYLSTENFEKGLEKPR
jgi:hypothetical protein